jgi:gliding motility-associated-like protein
VNTSISCNGGSNGSATASGSGGTSPYTFAWSNSATTVITNGLVAGTYTVTVSDVNSCTSTSSVTITQPTALTASIVVNTNVSCNGGSNGSATASGLGGTSPYTFVWSNSATTASITGVLAGTYTVTITDANNCTSTPTTTITEPGVLVTSIQVNQNVSIFGTNDGSVTANGSGGILPYTYLWNTTSTTATINNLFSGVYTVTTTDGNNCISIRQVTVFEPGSIRASMRLDSNVTCNGGINGGVGVSITGGVKPYTLQWSNSQTDSTLIGLSAGIYTVTVTDGNGGRAVNDTTVTEPAQLVATASIINNASCNGLSDGTATANGSGGTSPYTFAWSNAVTRATINGLVAGTYTVTVTDANNCTSTATTTITEPAVLTASTVNTSVSCNGGSNGSVIASGTGGTTPYIFRWSNAATTATASGLAAGTYTATVTDANNCTLIATTTITEPTVLTVSTVNTSVSCNGGSNGTATASGSGGTAPYSFGWSTSTSSATFATTATASGLLAGTYTVTVSDANNCTTTASTTVTEPTAVVARSVVNTNISCNGGSNGSATASGSGGIAPYSYAWSTSTSSATFATTASITGVTAGTYTVTVSDANSCTSTSSVTITEPTAVVASSVVNTSINCNGGSNGSATASGSGGTSPYTFAWSTSTSSATFATTASITGVTAGTYTVTVSDANSCTSTSSVTIFEPVVLAASTVANTNVSCNGGSNGSATVSGTGGTTPYTFAWSNSSTTATASGLLAGTYTVTLSDANSCTTTSSITVTEPTLLVSSIQVNQNVSIFGTNDGSVTASGTGGILPYSFAWSNSATTATINNLFSGIYTVTITDGNNCSSSKQVTVFEPGSIRASMRLDSNVTCIGGINGGVGVSVTGGVKPYTFLWSNSQTDSTITGLSAGTYTVTVRDANGGTAVNDTTVTEPTQLVATASIINNASCGGINDGAAQVSVTGGTLPYAFIWSNSATTIGISNLFSGVYSVTTTDGNNCTAIATVNVLNNDTVAPVLLTQPLTIYLDANGIAFITANDLDNGTADNCQLAGIAIDSSSFDCSEVGTNTVNFKAVDVSGNRDSVNVTITVIDSVKPLITTQPLTVYLDANGQSTITVNDLDNGTSDNCQLASIAIDSTTFDCSEVGLNTVVFTAIDITGNTSTSTEVVTVVDTIKPIIAIQPLTVYLDGNGLATITATDLDNGTSDNCQIASIAIDSANFDCSEVGLNTVVFTAIDNTGNTSINTEVVTVVDSIKPIISTQPLTIYLNANGIAFITANDLDNGTADNCQLASILIDSSSFDCSEVGVNTVNFKVVDAGGNKDSVDVLVTVVDSIKPLITTQPVTVYLDVNGLATIIVSDLDNGTSDNCQLASIAIDSTTFDCSEVGLNTVVFTAIDITGNTSTSTEVVTVVDTIKPIIAIQPLTVYSDGNGLATITATDLDNGTSDNCQVATIAIDSSSFDCSEIGVNTVNFKAIDASGNRDSVNVTVTVIDSIKPTIATQPLTVYLGTNGLATIGANDLDNGTSDNCQVASISIDSTTFDISELGPNNVRFTAIDVNNNRDSIIEVVTVLDTISPIVANCPSNITASTALNSCDALVTWIAPIASDNGQLDSLIGSYVIGSAFPLGTTTITYIAYDQSMNTDTCSFTITVIDSVAPIIANAPSNITVSNDTGQCGAVVSWILPTATDNCQLDSLVSSLSVGALLTLGTTTVTYIAYDAAMNTDTISFTVTVNDVEKPTLACIADTTICDGVFTYAVPITTDNCGVASVVRTAGLASGSTFPVGSTLITHLVTDIHGNADSCSFTVTQDELPTVATAGVDYNVCSDTVILTGNNLTVGTGLWSSATSGITILSPIDPASSAVLQRGVNTLVWTISNGVCASSSDTVTITYDSEPTIANAGSDQILCDERSATMEANIPQTGTGVWSLLSGSGMLSNVNNGNAAVSGLSDGVNELSWTISNGVCASSRDTITLKGANNPVLTIISDTAIFKEDGVKLYVISDILTTMQYSWSPMFSLDNSLIQTPFARPDEDTRYSVRVTTLDGCFADGFVDITVVKRLIIPGAFTPNGDGQNDTWEIKNLEELDSYDVIVYDGFGSEVFRSNSFSPWDGKYKGNMLSVGSYYYLIKYELMGKYEDVTGVISILR